VSNDLVQIKEKSLNFKFKPHNISNTNQNARISFELPKYIVSTV
jgi:hypothetical protein